ncbi:hypothetical protein BX600DRAFT_554160 [Xylariales sp. PMI_506]|nr:hypothetical protein BX600DRAFT_554160 [Xylariales sp. PMI_506]
MSPEAFISGLRTAIPDLEVHAPDSPGFATQRQTRGNVNVEITPPVVAVPSSAEQVGALVRWLVSSNVPFTVRSGGNDFFGRNVAHGAVMIDMRKLNAVSVAQDRQTATIGGGIIVQDLVRQLEAVGLITPFGNTWIVGYVGWATVGGYGPFTGALGMGFEQIVGAQIVNAKGDVVDVTERSPNADLLEGLRGMGGNLGIVTSLTIKVYPRFDLLSGALIYQSSDIGGTIRAYYEAEKSLQIPVPLSLHHFINMDPETSIFSLVVLWTWADDDHEAGRKYLDIFLKTIPPAAINTVSSATVIQHQERMPIPCPPWGGQRSIYLREMTTEILDIIIESLKAMPKESGLNVSWSDSIPQASVANCFGAGRHVFFSSSSMVFQKENRELAEQWNKGLVERIRSSGDGAVMSGAYASLNPPGERTPGQIFGEAWHTVQELKTKYDPDNIFRYAYPTIGLQE